jgi:gas vesicle protein
MINQKQTKEEMLQEIKSQSKTIYKLSGEIFDLIKKHKEELEEAFKSGKQKAKQKYKDAVKKFNSEFIHPKCINEVRKELLKALEEKC